VHAVDPIDAANEPRSQLAHIIEAASAEYMPVAQLEQEVEAEFDWKVPTVQFVHTVAPVAEYVPALQVNTQDVESPRLTE